MTSLTFKVSSTQVQTYMLGGDAATPAWRLASAYGLCVICTAVAECFQRCKTVSRRCRIAGVQP